MEVPRWYFFQQRGYRDKKLEREHSEALQAGSCQAGIPCLKPTSHTKVKLLPQGSPEAWENSQNSWTRKQSFPEEATACLLPARAPNLPPFLPSPTPELPHPYLGNNFTTHLLHKVRWASYIVMRRGWKLWNKVNLPPTHTSLYLLINALSTYWHYDT